jgi:uncharacterized protein (TIGR02001 family)
MSRQLGIKRLDVKRAPVAATTLLLAVCGSGCSSLEPEYGLSAPLVSRYVYRGAVVNRDPVLQPEVFASAKSGERTWLVGAWSNVDLTDENAEEHELTEYDVYGEVSETIGPVNVALGVTHFRYEQPVAPSTTELHLSVGAESEVVTPTLELFYDIDEAQGLYVNANLSRSIEPVEGWTLGLLAGVGWMSSGQAEYNFGVDARGLSDLLLQADIAHPLSDHATLGLTVAYSAVLDSELRDAVDDSQNLWVAIGVGLNF